MTWETTTPVRLVITGPESTGKSMLVVDLARRLGVPHALEYARMYLEEQGPAYDFDLLGEMSRGHVAYQQDHVPESAPLGIFDTDLINYKIWCEVAFGSCHPDILAGLERQRDHVYLVCEPDLPWEPDPLREHPEDRWMLLDRHVEEIKRLNRPYRMIRGVGPERFDLAEAMARELLGW